jgi:GT2 family glycosyltransferase
MTSPDLSIVIVSYNAGASLRRCLRSLTPANREMNWEIIVVDNQSTDGLPSSLKAEFPHVQFFENEINLGFGRAFNQGAKMARSDFVLSLNGDTEPEAESLALLLDQMRSAPRAGAVGPKLLLPNGQNAVSAFRFPTLLRPTIDSRFIRIFAGERFSLGYPAGDPRLQRGGSVDWISGACVLFRKEAIREVGYFNDRYFMYFEDVDVCRRLWDAGWEVLYCTRARVTHEGGASSTGLQGRLAFERQRSRLVYFSEHGSRVAYALMRLWTAVASIGRSLRYLLTLRGDLLRTEMRILFLAIRGAGD